MYRTTYSQAQVEGFIERFEFPSECMNDLRQVLEDNAKFYFDCVASEEESWHQESLELKAVAEAVRELEGAVSVVSPHTWALLADQSDLWRGISYAPFIVFEGDDPESYQDAPDIVTFVQEAPYRKSDIRECRTNLQKIIIELGVLADIAKRVEADFPQTKPGPKPNVPLRLWIRETSWMWARFSKEKPTYEAHNGLAVSRYAQFAVAAFHCIDPSFPERKILTATRTMMKEAPDGPVSSLQDFWKTE